MNYSHNQNIQGGKADILFERKKVWNIAMLVPLHQLCNLA